MNTPTYPACTDDPGAPRKICRTCSTTVCSHGYELGLENVAAFPELHLVEVHYPDKRHVCPPRPPTPAEVT